MGCTIQGDDVQIRPRKFPNDAYRYPDQTQTCHGVAKKDPVPLSAGQDYVCAMSGGAAHDGGHCVMAVTKDQKTWFKINDIKDCTLTGEDKFSIPYAMPSFCTSGCTLGWFWTPKSSGGCEIYNNCFDVIIENAQGGLENVAPSFIADPIMDCKRVGADKLSRMFANYVGATPDWDSIGDGEGGVTVPVGPVPVPAQPVSPDSDSPTCKEGEILVSTDLPATYTVVTGDTLLKISEKYDLENWDSLFRINTPDPLTDPNILNIGDVLKLPQTQCVDDLSSEAIFYKASMDYFVAGGHSPATIRGLVSVSMTNADLSLTALLEGVERSAVGGIHIHYGTSCASESTIEGSAPLGAYKGHFYSPANPLAQPESTEDPWSSARWESDSAGNANIRIMLTANDLGASPLEAKGRVVIVQNVAGDTIGCAEFSINVNGSATVSLLGGIVASLIVLLMRM
jgi:LysM repeat protein